MLNRFFITLLIILSPAIVRAGVVYDTMNVDLALLQPIGVAATVLQFPTLYSGVTGEFTTEMSTEVVPNGINGVDSAVMVTGEPGSGYRITFSNGKIPLTGPMADLNVDYNITDGRTERTLSDKGADVFMIMGTLRLDRPIVAGTYTGQIDIYVEYYR